MLGDANADWLAYGLEDAFSEKPEIAIVRKHRTNSGLIRYDPRRDVEWPQAAREIIAAEKPKFIVMMIGNNDRVLIREKAPPVVRPPAGGQAGRCWRCHAGAPSPPQPPRPRRSTGSTRSNNRRSSRPSSRRPMRAPSRRARHPTVPWEFHTEKWEIAYIKRVDATISALKERGRAGLLGRLAVAARSEGQRRFRLSQ